ncbi:RagB/SusD family nutrient uptake outer membrane protein [Niabella hibiscisoli]|uniref:RagB/SusD family nutrient uptake outer membrane protein n=1 Tax=Niabella hibiscisoli TaxID=1825928 RepID=UPI001F0F003A|nr:RagB/SusD family nutrient uptake outer membrane protein [Niabella hibiscisoli]MCH5719935.1 RagB/SusD family nutrient uptake outer membrane protein [Niabella hibiscisoli]
MNTINKWAYFLILWLTGGCIILCLSGCKKYLDYPFTNNVRIPTYLSDLQGLMDDAATMNENRTPSLVETSSDDYFCLPERYAALDDWPKQAYIWKPYDYRYPNDWAICYYPIYISNFCLDMSKDIERTSGNASEWDHVNGSAYFFRAYYFLQLAWTYALAYDEATASSDKGIVLRLTSNYNDPSVRSSVAETYKQIIQDAQRSASLLPNLPMHSYRPSKAAAFGLLARAYLSMRMYDSAYYYADQAIAIKSDLINYNGDPDLGTLTINYPFKRFNKETLFYSEMNTTGTSSLILASRARIDSMLMNNYETNDLRRTAYFTKSGNYYQFKGSYTQTSRNFTGISTAELLLIRAECLVRSTTNGSGNLQKALEDLNNLLSKRYRTADFIPVTANTREAALDRILLERRKELLFRGLRWMEVKRLNKEGKNIVMRRFLDGNLYTLEANASYYALPIPIDIIEVTGIPQN